MVLAVPDATASPTKILPASTSHADTSLALFHNDLAVRALLDFDHMNPLLRGYTV